MSDSMYGDVSARIEGFIRDRFLDDSDDQTLTATSPVLEWGILTSMNTAVLLVFIREQFDVAIPPMNITASNFRDVQSISTMVCELLPAAQPA